MHKMKENQHSCTNRQGLMQDLNLVGDIECVTLLKHNKLQKILQQIGLLHCFILSLDKYVLL